MEGVQVVGTFVAAFVATLVGVRVLGLVAKLFQLLFALRRLRLEAAGAAGLAATPDHITLHPTGVDPWNDRAAAGRLVRGFERQGFRSGGTFLIDEMPETFVQLFVHPDENLIGVAYEHPQAGHWADVVEYRTDGTGTTWTSAPETGLDPRPGHTQIREPGASVDRLVARARSERGPGPAQSFHPSELAALVERAYAEESAWRKSRGITREEMERIARNLKEAA